MSAEGGSGVAALVAGVASLSVKASGSIGAAEGSDAAVRGTASQQQQDQHQQAACVQLYRTIDRASSLLFGVDKDLEDLPPRRVRRQAQAGPMSGVDALKVKHNTDPDTVSLGYGELTMGGFARVVRALEQPQTLFLASAGKNGTSSASRSDDENAAANKPTPVVSGGDGKFEMTDDGGLQRAEAEQAGRATWLASLSLGEGSVFVDIGSGFGKCVMQVPVRVPGVAQAIGIEYSQIRHMKAQEALNTLMRSPSAPGARKTNNNDKDDNDAAATAKGPTESSPTSLLTWKQMLAPVRLIQGDATKFDYAAAGVTHIFMYDYIFSEATHRALLPRIAACDFKLFACFCNLRKLRARGFDADVELLCKMPIGNTGGENHTVFIYCRPFQPEDTTPEH